MRASGWYIWFSVLGCLLGRTSVSGGTIDVPDDFATIQDAIDAAVTDDVIVVYEDPSLLAIYYEQIDFIGKAITVKAYEPRAITLADLTPIASDGSMVTFASGEGRASVLEGFVIIGGDGTEVPGEGFLGGAVFCDGASPTVRDCLMDNNMNGAVGIYNGSPVIEDCEIRDNFGQAVGGGGFLVIGEDAAPVVRRCTIGSTDPAEGNVGDFVGGGAYIRGGATAHFDDCTFENNVATFGGGAIYSEGAVFARNCRFVGNDALGGGAVFIAQPATLPWDEMSFEHCRFLGNGAAAVRGAALYIDGEPGAPPSPPTIDVLHCFFLDHSPGGTAPTQGAVLFCGIGDAVVGFASCTMVNNYADLGDCIMVGSGPGASPPISSSHDVTVTNSIVWDTTGSDDYDAFELGLGDGTLEASYSDVEYFDPATPGPSDPYAPPDVYEGEGNIHAAPEFVDQTVPDYRITFESPCRDAGDPASPPDADESRADMGALPHLYGFKRGDFNGDGSTAFPFVDARFLLEYGFLGGPPPPCDDAADFDDNGFVSTLFDPFKRLHHAFKGGSPPPAPGLDGCGLDPTGDALDCDVFTTGDNCNEPF